MTTSAFASAASLRLVRSCSATNCCGLVMRKDKPKPSKSDRKRERETESGLPSSQGPLVSAEEMLRKDLQTMRARRKSAPQPKKDESPLANLKSALDTLLLWDFFLVIALLGWLVIALIPHFTSKNDVLLDPWLGLWQPFIQPVLGVLMLGTIVQGTISFINSKN